MMMRRKGDDAVAGCHDHVHDVIKVTMMIVVRWMGSRC